MIKLSIKIKVLIILLLLTTIMIVSMALNMQNGFNKGFFNYRKAIDNQFHNNLVSTLQGYYAEKGNWQELRQNRRLWNDLINQSTVDVDNSQRHRLTPESKPLNGKKSSSKRNSFRKKLHRMRMLPPISLFDQNKDIIIGKVSWQDENLYYKKIVNQHKLIGYLGILKNNTLHDKQDQIFIKNIKSMLLNLGIIMIVFAIVITFPIAKYFTSLINQLTIATQKIAKGDYSIRIKSERNDELGHLAKNFNLLAKTLESNAKSQKTIMADIAHELRTPIAVIIGEIEAIQDGIHPADESTLNLLHTQISSLISLVDDLHDLSESDLGSLKYKMEKFDVLALIEECYQAYQLKFTQKNIHLEILSSKRQCTIIGDSNRLKQMFNNLLSNSVHYTSAGGKAQIALTCTDKQVQIVIKDSTPGLKPEQLDKIFDRWYRGEKSRNRNSGGSGLGLAICQKIIAAHSGHIEAKQSSYGGVEITIKLPR
ncbi:MAG: HAMP domain-containing protein [Alcanivoracaceae bacterium]|nr:HAMP domain-containing protein [Alcanivoracaceae bacterium]